MNAETKQIKPFLKNHTLVLTTQYQNIDGWDGMGWNNPDFLKQVGFDDKFYIVNYKFINNYIFYNFYITFKPIK